MDFEKMVIEIRKFYWHLNQKNADVTLTYKGKDYGESNPWIIKCEAREASSDSPDKAASALLISFKKELHLKAESLRLQAAALTQVISESTDYS